MMTVRQLPEVSNFTQNMLHYQDEHEAKHIYTQYMELEFKRSTDGVELETLYQSQTALEQRLASLCEVIKGIKQKLSQTPRDIENPQKPAISFGSWALDDLFTFWLCILQCPVLLVMSGANIYSNIMASGEAVFLDNPWLAVTLSFIAPAGACVIKFAAHSFEYHKPKKRYAASLALLTSACFLIWTYLFSQRFAGIGSGIDLDALLEEGSDNGEFLVWLQMVTEILISASLVLTAEAIYRKYNPTIDSPNPLYIAACEDLQQQDQLYDALQKERVENHGRIVALEALQQIFVHDALAQFLVLRAKYKSF